MYQAKVREITYDNPTILKDGRWCVYANFSIVGLNESDALGRVVYAQVCSPSYLEAPIESEPTNAKTLILDFLDKEHLAKYVTKIIDYVNEQKVESQKSYYAMLKEYYFDIDDEQPA